VIYIAYMAKCWCKTCEGSRFHEFILY